MSGEYPAHVVVSLAYTDMCVDMVAALHASCMTCVSTIVYTVCDDDRCILFPVIVHTEWDNSTDDSIF